MTGNRGTSTAALGLILLGLLTAGCASRSGDGAADLRAGFAAPPAAARPWVYWMLMDGNLDRDGMTADLEAMKRAGIGGVILMEVDVGIPKGPVKFMSAPWRALFKHAVTEAARLGLEVTVNAGPGWTGSGGPWVKAEQSMQHLVASALRVSGPAELDSVLPLPAPREPHFVHVPVPAALRAAREEFYRDVAVLAFPTPADGPAIDDIDEKALYYRNPYSSMPGVKPYLPAPAEFPAAAPDTAIARQRIADLGARLEPGGRLRWKVPAGDWTIMRFGRRTTAANTRPAPEPGIGFECDKFDAAALDAQYDAFVGALLGETGPLPAPRTAGWTMLHIDSWEMGAQNWTAGFREEFLRRRGYDPLPYLPALTGRVVGSLEASERFLWDLRQTGQELVIDNHARRLKELGRRDGFGLSIEPYDMNPCADLSLGGVADVPMCEFWSRGYGFDTAFSAFEAVSIAHTKGRPVVAAESFTADAGEDWKLHPGNMKDQADWAFATGINRFVFHRYAHQPWLDRRPGMTMGPYGVHYERTETWWELSPAWHEYLARCQFLLRQGLHIADICYLAAEGAPHVFRPPQSALTGPQPIPDRRGYNFDGCAPETLIADMTVRDGRLVLPDGMSYRVLVLPEMETMTPALLRKVKELVTAGATVVGPRPSKSPGLAGYPDCDREVAALAAELWGGGVEAASPAGRAVGAGKIFVSRHSDPRPVDPAVTRGAPDFPPLYGDYEQVAGLLASQGVPPDFETDGPIRYAHRRAGGLDIYFVANRENAPVEAKCLFRTAGGRAELWDPMDGSMRPLPVAGDAKGRSAVALKFEPHGSFFVVFGAKGKTAGSPGSPFPEYETIAPLPGPWTVGFDPGLGGPAGPVAWASLDDWAARPEEGIRHYSGTAAYRTSLVLPTGARGSLALDLGRVEVMARVKLNGRDLGVRWMAPFRFELGDAAKPGENELEIVVANLWPNRLIGDQGLPEEKRVSWTTRNPYKPGDPLLPSGLLGPVVLVRRK